jgi:hypothetical protein
MLGKHRTQLGGLAVLSGASLLLIYARYSAGGNPLDRFDLRSIRQLYWTGQLVLDHESPNVTEASALLSDISRLPEEKDSAAWAPLVLSECMKGMPRHYAPCRPKRGVQYAEELLYPDFAIATPTFPRREDQDRWESTVGLTIKDRAQQLGDWMVYRGQTGQSFVLANRTFSGQPRADSWSADACMGSLVSDSGLLYMEALNETTYETEFLGKLRLMNVTKAHVRADTVIIVTGPDSWSYQHFLDRSTHTMIQALRLDLPPLEDTFVLTGREEQTVVTEMWQMLGFSPNQHIHSPASLSAKNWIFSCRTPLIHPYPSLRLAELFHVNRDVPLEDRKVVLYNSRSDGAGFIGGREILNEAALLQQLRALLEQRGLGEELVVLTPDRFKTAAEAMQWTAQNVRAMIGPHGAKFQYLRWCAASLF